MLNSLRIARSRPYLVLKSTPLGRKTTTVTLLQAKHGSTRPDHQVKIMDAENNRKKKELEGDVMSHSFGEGYATRSDEEGFGGIYGGNQSLPKPEDSKEVHENHPEYDKNQGSHVKEKEKGRNQPAQCLINEEEF